MAVKRLFFSSVIGGTLLGGFAVLAAFLLGAINTFSAPMIDTNKQARLEARLTEVLNPELYNNDLLADKTCFDAGLSKPIAIYRARHNGQPVAVVFATYTPKGYSGDIELVVGLHLQHDGTVEITGVRATDHKETPGLGDKIEADRDDWIKRFAGLSYSKLAPEQWTVKKDGGAFDQFTGATITPRAVVDAVNQSLQQFSQQHATIFAQPAIAATTDCSASTN